MPVGVLVDPKAEVKPGVRRPVVWDATQEAADAVQRTWAGIDIEQVAEEHPNHVGRWSHLETCFRSVTTRPGRSFRCKPA